MTQFEPIPCRHGNVTLNGSLIRPQSDAPRGAVLMVPGATGPGDSFRKAMILLAAEGYLAIGIDMYGSDADISTPQAAGQHFAALQDNPSLLRERIAAWFETVRALPGIDLGRIAAIGYCFGGKCVLELARSGAPVAAVVSYHGLLTTHAPARLGDIKAEIAIWTGGGDPYVPAQDVETLRMELDAAGAAYQICLFSYARHSFTDPDHDGLAPGIAYNARAHRVSWAGTLALLAETIGK